VHVRIEPMLRPDGKRQVCGAHHGEQPDVHSSSSFVLGS
jgi:hypothetical protein